MTFKKRTQIRLIIALTWELHHKLQITRLFVVFIQNIQVGGRFLLRVIKK